MGTGYSNKFSGTAGARGEQETYQSTFFDKFPVRTKLAGAGTGVGGAGGLGLPTRNKKCSCCGENSIPVRTEYTVCPVCGWIDDPYQNKHPDSLNGQNAISLKEAREI
jgi:hypothetical protein